MKTINLVLAFLFISLTLFAQSSLPKISRDFTYETSKPYKVVDGEEKDYFYHNDKIHKITQTKKTYYLQKFDAASMKELGRKEVKHGLDNKSWADAIVRNEDKYYLIYEEWEWGKNKDKDIFYYKEIDMNDLSVSSSGKKLLAVDGEIPTNESKGLFRNMINFWRTSTLNKSFHFSSDSVFFMVQYRKAPITKNDTKNYDYIGLFVYDLDLELQWGKEVKMPYTEAQMDNMDYAVDNEGNAYILARVTPENTGDRKDDEGNPNYHFQLMQLTKDKEGFETTKIGVEGKFLSSDQVYLFEGPRNNMVIAGFYSNRSNSNDVDGVFMAKVNKRSGDIDELAHHEIPVDILNLYEKKRVQKRNERRDKKGKAQFENLELSELYFHDDGSVLLIGEQYYITTTRVFNANGGSTVSYHTHYDDLLVTKINKEGSLGWIKKVPKRQQGPGNGIKRGMSYRFTYTNGNHYFFFLDNVRNLGLLPDQPPKLHMDGKGGFFTSYKIDHESGELEKLSLFDMQEVRFHDGDYGNVYQFLTDRILPLGNNQFAIELYKKKKEDVLIKVKIKD